MSIFIKKNFKMHSGGIAQYKVECNDDNNEGHGFTDEDLDTLAFIVSQKRIGTEQVKISKVYGVPTGGLRLAKAFDPYLKPGGLELIVDDVLTTGNSMELAKFQSGFKNPVGLVIVARGPCPNWVKPILTMSWFNTIDQF